MYSSAISSTSLSDRWFWKQRNGLIDIASELADLRFVSTNSATQVESVASLDSIKTTWQPTINGEVPSEIHAELLQRNLIPDPYIAFGEHEVQWIADAEWLYGCSFTVPASSKPNLQLKSAILTFEGLDTICDIYLNGERILETDNMFRGYEYRLPIEPGSENVSHTLLLHFRSAKALAKALEAEHGLVRAGSFNLGDASRVYVRKAQYGWRWDWGPELMTCGPYRPITLTAVYHPVHIEDVWAKSWVTLSHSSGSPSYLPSLGIDVTFALLPGLESEYSVEIALVDPDNGKTVKATKLAVPGDSTSNEAVLRLDWSNLAEDSVQPWWPAGMGPQKLYRVDVRLQHQSIIIQEVSKRVGFRSIRLIQGELQEADQYGKGTTFFFEINGEPIFAGGSNWIPADNLLTTLTEQRYREWLTLARDGNQIMVRIWGGGIYEPDVFYSICDELGLLVWQDFQFACGVYPGLTSPENDSVAPRPYPAFVENVKKEAEYNVKRLRHHPCMAVWCGNNEDYQMVLQWGDVPHLPATVIYEDVLPSVVTSLTSFTISNKSGGQTVGIPYVRGSPYGGQGWDTADPTVGDVHQWNIWGGKELPYQEYGRLGGRFVSEFGIPSFPSMKTVEYWMQGVDKSEWYAQSKAMAQHIRAGSYERRFAIVMNENFRNVASNDLNRYRFNTQVMQSEAVSYAYQIWKREWRGKGKEYCGGVLVWQLNDCWPVTSWALVDYFMRPKPVYYTVARRLAPVTVNVLREVVQNRANDRPKQFYEYGATRSLYANLQVWATNGTRNPLEVKLDIQYFDLESDWTSVEDFSTQGAFTSTFTLHPNQSTDLISLICPSPPNSRLRSIVGPGIDGSGTVVVLARLLDPTTNEVMARFVDWPQPFRYLNIPDPKAVTEIFERDADTGDARVRITVAKPVKCLWLELESSMDGEGEVKWSDNALDVVPGDPQEIMVKGLDQRDVKVMWLEG